MDASVIICTHNRCESLRRTLESMCTLEVPGDVSWELIVVDNNSSDGTRAVCEEFQKKHSLPLRYIFEPKQGHSRARNRGISEAASEAILFTDDDVNVTPHWLSVFVQTLRRHPDASFFGGRIYPLWENGAPAWADPADKRLHGLIMYFDKGETERQFTKSETVFGANMGFRKVVFQHHHFREDLGKKGTVGTLADDTEFIERLIMRGYTGVYMPDSVIHHRNDQKRGTERYLLNYFKGVGKTHVRLEFTRDAEHKLFGTPRYLWRELITHATRLLCSRLTKPAHVWVTHEIKLAETWGAIEEFRQRNRK